MDPQFATTNLEDGMPSVPQALARLAAELQSAQRRKIKVLKLVHGYGSSGVGGDLRISIQSKLRQMVEIWRNSCVHLWGETGEVEMRKPGSL